MPDKEEYKKVRNFRTEEYRSYRRKYRKLHRKRFKEKVLKYESIQRDRDREKLNYRARDFYNENKDKCRSKNRRYLKLNSDKVNSRRRKYSSNPQYRIRQNLSSRIRRFSINKVRFNASTMKLLGCSLQYFIEHLESLFDTGMSWDNYGYTGWHIDHIMPCSSFDLTNESHRRRCFHFSNLRPLWASDNLSKLDKIITGQFNLL